MENETYHPTVCECCDQALDYRVGLSKGHVRLMAKFAAAIRAKGINAVVPSKELATGKWGIPFTVTEMKALSQVRLHGLLAMSREHAGNWLLTTKGADFLRGRSIPRYALVLKRNKATSEHTTGYWEAERNMITAGELLKEGEYWRHIDFIVHESRIIYEKDLPKVGENKQGAML